MYEITIRVDDPDLASRLASMVVRSECYASIRGVRVALVTDEDEEEVPDTLWPFDGRHGRAS